MKPNEVAKLTGITVRTLQYYDKIGLLKPSETSDIGYRTYHKKDLEALQQILFFRELDFSLAEIKEIMENPNYDRNDALEHQKQLLIMKRDRLNEIIELVSHTLEGDETMSFKELDHSKIDEYKDTYAKEVKERWGNTDAYQEFAQKSKGYNKNKWNDINEGAEKILAGFAPLRGTSPDSKEAFAQVKLWQDYITANHYTCTKQILSGLGLMYEYDERFKSNIDKYGESTAQFMSDAIAAYCKEN